MASSFRSTTSGHSSTPGHHPPLPPHKPSPGNVDSASEPGSEGEVIPDIELVTMDSKPQQPRYDEASGGRVKTSSGSASLVGYGAKSNGSVVTGNGSVPGANYANGSSLTGTGASAVSSSSSYSSSANYRLASLDRLAQRQKLYETNGSSSTSGDASSSKRELFFKNDTLPAPALSTSINTNTPPVMKGEMSGTGQTVTTGKPDILKIQQPQHHHQHHANGLDQDHHREKQDRDKKSGGDDKKFKQLDGYVGFANLPNQVYRKAVKRGFDFTLMVVGGSGLGKSTLINSMFLTDVYSAEYPGPSLRLKKTVQVETSRIVLKEKGVNLTLTIVDTPGFGDAVDNSNCWQPVMDFVESRYEDYLNSESRVDRTKKPVIDPRVHVCLYFIAPSGHGLKPLDIELMRKLADKVNLIPVIGKADTMTPEECSAFKKQILNELTQQKIKIYSFPDIDDEEENKLNKQLRDRVPFAVVGSNTILEIDGRKLRGRKYPWGTVIVENMDHSDFVPLRNMVLRTHLQDLKDVTNNVHYENYRVRKLAGIGTDGKPVKGGIEKNPLAQMEDEKKNHDQKMKKMEQEMEVVFEMKVKERNQRLIDSEIDLKKREESMKKSLEKLEREIEDRKKWFETEKFAWEQQNGMTFDELRRKNMENLTKEAYKSESGVIVGQANDTTPPKKEKKINVKRSKSLRQSNGSTSSGSDCRPT